MNREQQLQAFVDYCQAYIKGDEKGEAQIFLDHLFTAFGYPDGLKGAEGVAEHRIRFTLDEKSSTRFADLVIPGRVLIEMKKRGEDLEKHYPQAMSYWQRLVPAPQYMVLCNFDEFWVYDMHYQASAPMGKVRVAQLAEAYGPLRFLFFEPEPPVFSREFDLVELTKAAAGKLSQVFRSMVDKRQAAPREQARRFILQCMLALFAEDIGLLPRYTFTQVIDDCLRDSARSHDLFLLLFTMMNTPGQKRAGRFYGVEYFDGGLFQTIYPMELSGDELALLRETADHNWGRIRPEIFGTIFEQTTDEAERHDFGIHYTSQRDILRIIEPVIVRPWLERIEAAATPGDLRTLHSELCAYRVLDPACGSGNFLYVAYQEMKRLEKRLFDRLVEMGDSPYPPLPETAPPPPAGDKPKLTARAAYAGPESPWKLPERVIYPPMPTITTAQFYGFDIKPFAVELAKVTLMIAKKMMIDELALRENALPLDNLDANIRAADALFADWPEFDACIGNPPYMGAKRLKQEHPAEYINRVRDAFPDVPGNADYCVYWFNRAHKQMKPGARAGLVGTNTIRQNYSREGGLDVIVQNGGHIFEAVSSMPWSGEAAVHVSIACWEKAEETSPVLLSADSPHPPTTEYPAPPLHAMERGSGGEDESSPTPPATEYPAPPLHEVGRGSGGGVSSSPVPHNRMARLWLDGDNYVDVPQINSSLSAKTDVSGAVVLSCNTEPKRVFQGQTPGHDAFILSYQAANQMVRDKANLRVITPYLVGRDLISKSQSQPERFIINMNGFDLTEAKQFQAVYKHLEKYVLPVREANAADEAKKNQEVLAANPNARTNHHHEMFLRYWWRHSYDRSEMIEGIRNLGRYIVCSRVTKRPIFEFTHQTITPGDSLQVFLFDDDYSFGILQSNAHWQWFTEKGSTLTERFRYTPNSVFDTFPWPQKPKAKQVKAVADAGRALHEWRRAKMADNPRLTLRELYRSLELPGKYALRDLHAALDRAVLAAYGFDRTDDLLARLLELNQTVAARIEAGESVAPPGIPADYPDPAALVSPGCITPPALEG